GGPSVSSRLKPSPSRSKFITAEETELPRSRSTAIQSERIRTRRSPRASTSPASWIAPPNSSSFPISVVLPASGCEMIAKVRRRRISPVRIGSGRCSNSTVLRGLARSRAALSDKIVDHFDLDLLDLQQMLPLMMDQLIELLADRAHFELGLEVDLVIVLGPQAVARLLAGLAHRHDWRPDRRQPRPSRIQGKVTVR